MALRSCFKELRQTSVLQVATFFEQTSPSACSAHVNGILRQRRSTSSPNKRTKQALTSAVAHWPGSILFVSFIESLVPQPYLVQDSGQFPDIQTSRQDTPSLPKTPNTPINLEQKTNISPLTTWYSICRKNTNQQQERKSQ